MKRRKPICRLSKTRTRRIRAYKRRNPGSKADQFHSVRPGDRVTFMQYAGLGRHGPEYKRATGRVVMIGTYGPVLNMGGTHGRPAVVTRENFVSVQRSKARSNPTRRNGRDQDATYYLALGHRFDSVEQADEWARQKILNMGKDAEPISIMEKQDMLKAHVLYTIDPKRVRSAYNPRKLKLPHSVIGDVFKCKMKGCSGDVRKGVFAHRIAYVCPHCGAVYDSKKNIRFKSSSGLRYNPRKRKVARKRRRSRAR